MGNLILYKFGVIGVLIIVALWSFHVLPDNNDDTKAVLSEEFFEEPVVSASAKSSLSPTVSPTKISVPVPTSTLTYIPSAISTQIPSASSTGSLQASSGPTAMPSAPLVTPTLTPTPLVIATPYPIFTPTPTPSSSLSPDGSGSTVTPSPSATPEGGHIFYLSTYTTAKYYYCDTDNGWKSLSEKYLKSYPSEQELLADYPTKILHEPCK